MKLQVLAAAIAAAFSAQAMSQARVVESQAVIDNRPSVQDSNSALTQDGATQQAEIFYQMQQLQQEVLTLRGMVEEQSNDIKRLKQQRMDDYLDLDKRISSVVSQGAVAPSANAATQAVSAAGSGLSTGNEVQDYRAAINTVLKQRDYKQGEDLLKAYVANYPQGKYLANSQYWLGQVYLATSNYESAKERFKIVAEQYPESTKANDALFKLGKVQHLLGDNQAAKVLLEKAAAGTGAVAKEARRYIEQSFK